MTDAGAERAPDIRRWVLRFLTRSYAIGPDTYGAPRLDDWLSDAPPDTVWTPEQVTTVIGFLSIMFVSLCHEIDTAKTESRAVDIPAFLDRQALYLVIADAAQAEGISIRDVLERLRPGVRA